MDHGTSIPIWRLLFQPSGNVQNGQFADLGVDVTFLITTENRSVQRHNPSGIGRRNRDKRLSPSGCDIYLHDYRNLGKTMPGQKLLSPITLNKLFATEFLRRGWKGVKIDVKTKVELPGKSTIDHSGFRAMDFSATLFAREKPAL